MDDAGQNSALGRRGSPGSEYPFIHLCPFGDDEGEARRRRPIEVDYSRYCARDVLPFSSIRDFAKRAAFFGRARRPDADRRVRKPVSAGVRAASYPAWPIVIEPGSGSLCASESIKLLLRAFRPSHNDEIAVSLRRKNFEAGPVLHDRHSNFFSCFHGRSLPQCEEPGPKVEETLSCGAAGWPGGTANRRGPARELLRPR
jgi:hypothetical protein